MWYSIPQHLAILNFSIFACFSKSLVKIGFYEEIMAGIDLRSKERLANHSREELDQEYYDEIWHLPEKFNVKTSSGTLKAIQQKLYQVPSTK